MRPDPVSARLGESAALLVGAQDVEIIAVAPAMDVFARVWPECGKPAFPPTAESLACADRDGYERCNSVIACESCAFNAALNKRMRIL